MHAIISLENLQHKGSMVLRVGSLLDRASVDLVFVLYSLFKCAVIVRPYLQSALKDEVYLVCKELVDRQRADQICQCLKKIYTEVQGHGAEGDIGPLLDWNILEREDTLLQTVMNLNNEAISMRADLIEAALATSVNDDLYAEYQSRIAREKEAILKKWQIPVK